MGILFLLSTLLWTGSTTLHAQGTRIKAAPAASAPRLHIAERLRIGSLSGTHDAFGRIMDVKLDYRGRLFIADDQDHSVSVFTPAGKFIAKLGRSGRGPGEFQSPWKIGIDPQDSVFVWDAELARITVFSPELSYVRDFTTPAEWLINSIEFLPDGKLVIAAYAAGEVGGIHVLGRNGERIRSFGPSFPSGDFGGYESLNVIRDPVRNITLLDLLSDDCTLLRRSVMPAFLSIADHDQSLLVGVGRESYPEVIVYRLRVVQ